jgi:hypothetical protein
MTIAAPSIFPFRHDWATPFQVARTYQTDVQQSANGTEVRVQLRATPAISTTMECVFGTEFEAGQLLAAWRSAGQPLRFYAPLWCDATDLTAAVTLGDGTINCDTTDRPFFVAGGYAMIFRDRTHAEVVRVNTVSTSSFTLTGTAANSYAKAGTRVVPCRIMWLSLPMDVTWHSPRVASATISFVDEKDQAGYALADPAVAPVASSIEICIHSHGDASTAFHASQNVWFAEAVVFDDADLPMPSAEVVWSVAAGSVTITPSINSRFARITPGGPGASIIATSGAAATPPFGAS